MVTRMSQARRFSSASKLGFLRARGQEYVLADILRVGVVARAGVGQLVDQRGVKLHDSPDVHAVVELHGILPFQT